MSSSMSAQEIKTRTFNNLVWFYREELQHIIEGALGSLYFSSARIRTLKDMGILNHFINPGFPNSTYIIVTSRAQDVLLGLL